MTLRDDLDAMVLARDRPGWRRKEIGFPEYEKLLQSLEPFREAFVGARHITITDTKTRYVIYTDFPVTPGEAARQYLRWIYEQSPWGRIPPFRPAHDHPWFSKRAPVFVVPTRHRPMAYVDIDHAYWQILAPYSADHFVSSKTFDHLDGIVPWLRPDELDTDRELRHAMCGSLFASTITAWHYGVPQDRKIPARFANPTLQMLTFDTLTALCHAVRSRFNVYAWLTDACIVDEHDAEDVVAFLGFEWGILSRVVSHGMGEVWSPAAYAVGPKETKGLTGRRIEQAFDNVAIVDVERMHQWRNDALAKAPPVQSNPGWGARLPGSST